MKLTIRVGLLILAVLAVGCASIPNKTLDLAKLADKKFSLNEVTLMIRAELDKDGDGQNFLKGQYPNLISSIKSIAKSKGVEVDTAKFDEAFAAAKVETRKEVLNISANFVVNDYHWTIADESAQVAGLNITFAPHDGVLPASVNFSQVDPKDPKNPFTKTVTVDLKIQ